MLMGSDPVKVMLCGRDSAERKRAMKEDVYKTMNNVGTGNIAIGAVLIVLAVAAGVLAIVSGGRLLAKKDNLLF